MRASQERVAVTYFYIPKRLYLCTDGLFGFEEEFEEKEEKAAVLRFTGSFCMCQFSESRDIFLKRM